MNEKQQLLEQFEKALSNVCDLMEFERGLQGTEDFEELMDDQDYRQLVSMQVRYFSQIKKIHKQIDALEIFKTIKW